MNGPDAPPRKDPGKICKYLFLRYLTVVTQDSRKGWYGDCREMTKEETP